MFLALIFSITFTQKEVVTIIIGKMKTSFYIDQVYLSSYNTNIVSLTYVILFLQKLLMEKLGKQQQKAATQHITTTEAKLL